MVLQLHPHAVGQTDASNTNKITNMEKEAVTISVETTVSATVEEVWRAWNTPDDIKQWNSASEDWHTAQAAVDLCVGGSFSSRMEAKDGSMGFDFAGTYTRIIEHNLIESLAMHRRGAARTADNPARLITQRHETSRPPINHRLKPGDLAFIHRDLCRVVSWKLALC